MPSLENKRKIYVSFILPLIMVFLSLSNYLRLAYTEHIRTMHVITLLVMGMGLGVFLRNLIAYFRGEL